MRAFLPFVPLLLACQHPTPVAPRPSPSPFTWQTQSQLPHPLVGKILDRASGHFIDRAELARRASGAHFVLLGEKHDNPDHHRLQALVLQGMIDAGRRPVVGFEMLERGKQARVNASLASHPGQADLLAAAVDWDKSGWPEWAMYRPVFETALRSSLPILAANISTVQVRLAVKHGAGAFPDGELHHLGLDVPLPPAQQSALERELEASHCGMLPGRVVKAMVLGQRARDAMMTERLLQSDGPQGAVLIAGGEHVRRDRGVPLYLSVRKPDASILSIAWVEVSPGAQDPKAYEEAADVLWFTPRVDDEDPCEKFRGQFR